MIEKAVNFTFKARYFKLGEITPSTKQIWFVLHGYGQLAQYFIKKFKILEQHHICVIAPEGLSRFYLDELRPSGRKDTRVGATWMTRENRAMDIENYIEYLDMVYADEVKHHTIPVTLLGFSQGAATASRWALSKRINFNRLILWSGILPYDMDFEAGSKILHDKDVYVAYGKKDPFLNDDRFAEMQSLTKKLNKEIREITFEGGHEIDEDVLLTMI